MVLILASQVTSENVNNMVDGANVELNGERCHICISFESETKGKQTTIDRDFSEVTLKTTQETDHVLLTVYADGQAKKNIYVYSANDKSNAKFNPILGIVDHTITITSDHPFKATTIVITIK